jgi:hypothetical protein
MEGESWGSNETWILVEGKLVIHDGKGTRTYVRWIKEDPAPAPSITRNPTRRSTCQEFLDTKNNVNDFLGLGVLGFLSMVEDYASARSEGDRIDLEKYVASFDLENLEKYCTTNPERPFLDAVRAAYDTIVHQDKGEE